MLFDEPTAGLDPEERMRFKNLVRQLPRDSIVLISTHIVEDVEAVCDHVMVMRQGTVPVSYTHLDVYKRQLVERARELLPVPEVQQPEQEQERGHTWGLSLIHI